MAVDNTDDGTDTSNDDISLEDMDVDLLEEAESTEDQESKEEEATESEDEAEEASTEEQSESEGNEEESTEETADKSEETEEVELSPEEKRKAFNKEMAEKRIAEKRQRDEAIRQQQEAYIEQTEDPLEAATRQNQVELYNIKVENLTNKLTNGYEKAIKDFDILSDQTPEVKQMVDEAIDTFQALYVPVDAYGNPKEIKADFYQYLSNKAESIQKLTGIKSQKQTEAKTKEKSKVFTPPAKTPKPAKSDPMLDGFDEEVEKWG